MQTADQESTRGRRPIGWAIPAVGIAAGLAYLVAGIVGDDLGFGIFGLLLMLSVTAILVLVRTRSETVQGLLDRRDERINQLDLQATAVAGGAVIVAVLGGFVVEIARGQDGSPYAALGAIGGASYVIALVYLRLRR